MSSSKPYCVIHYYQRIFIDPDSGINFIDMNNILQNIDEIRRKKGYSQEYVAQQIGMKQSGFSLIMSGGRELKYNTLLQIAKALQEDVIDIITYPDKYALAEEKAGGMETILQIKLDKEKRDEVIALLFGDKGKEILE